MRLVEKKVRTLLLPLLFWNVPVVMTVFALQNAGLTEHAFRVDLQSADPIIWLNALVGIADAPVNFPLFFLRDLFVCSLLAPLLGAFLRHSVWAGALIVIANWYVNFDLGLIWRNEILLMFYLGGMAATLRWPLDALDRFAWPLLAGFLVLCVAATVVRNPKLIQYLKMLGVVALWPASSLVLRTQLGKLIVDLSRHSFFIFVSHGPILAGLWVVWKIEHFDLPYPAFWIAAPIAAVVAGHIAHDVLRRFAPRTASILTGARQTVASTP